MSKLEDVIALQFGPESVADIPDYFILHYIELRDTGKHRVQKWEVLKGSAENRISEKEADPAFVKWLSLEELRQVMVGFVQMMDAHGVYGRAKENKNDFRLLP